MYKRSAGLVLASLFIFIWTGCSPKHIGYGVMLWENKYSSYKNGERFFVLSKSTAQQAYLILDEKDKTKKEVPWGYIAFFSKEQEARSFSKSYKEYLHQYAYSQKRSLPVRESPEQGATIIYKLNENEVVKIVSRSEKAEKAGIYENYWYQLVTEDGHTGYCFGEFLTLFTTEGDPFAKAKEFQSADPALKSIMENVWRPEYFDEMIRNGRFDLNDFKPEIGLFCSPAEKKIEIKLPEHEVTLNYTNIIKVGNTYLFEGTDLRLEMGPYNILVVSFKDKGRSVTENFVLIKDDIEEIIKGELESREKEMSIFAGATLSSDAYGTITFKPDASYFWVGFDRLVPHIIPAGTQKSGQAGFYYYPGKGLASQYTGVISFLFNGMNPRDKINFLYKLDNEGVKLVYVNKASIEGIEVKSSSLSPLTLYFKIARNN
jgi:hypothetical protein